jgi:ATP-dependent Clp protease ATP-binding subunit ClpB
VESIRAVSPIPAQRERGVAGFDPVYGARPLKRSIQTHLETPLARELLAGRFGAGDTVSVEAHGEELGFHT